jgi:cell division septal protein FtsQ
MSDEDDAKRPSKRDSGESAESSPSRGLRPYKLALAEIGLLLLAGSPFWSPLLMRKMAFFRVRRVEIVGAHYLAPNDILARIHVDTTASVWDPTAPIAARVIRQPGVKSVEVHRRLPGTLVVEITEHAPVALVSAAGGLTVYDARGVALPVDPASVSVDAPVLMARDTTVLRLLGAMRQQMPSLYARVNTVRREGRDQLILQFKGAPVRAMQDVTLERLAEVEPVEADLSRKQLRVAEIDLRFRDQVIARLQ